MSLYCWASILYSKSGCFRCSHWGPTIDSKLHPDTVNCTAKIMGVVQDICQLLAPRQQLYSHSTNSLLCDSLHARKPKYREKCSNSNNTILVVFESWDNPIINILLLCRLSLIAVKQWD
jgi:hypothetical protein